VAVYAATAMNAKIRPPRPACQPNIPNGLIDAVERG